MPTKHPSFASHGWRRPKRNPLKAKEKWGSGHLADEIYSQFENEEIEQLDQLESPHIHLNNLTYPIHPLFQKSQWHHMNDSDWVVVEPVLRLASAFLESYPSLVFLYSVINSERIVHEESSRLYNAYITSITRPHELINHGLIAKLRTETKLNLDMLADTQAVMFNIYRASIDKEEMKRAGTPRPYLGHTSCTREREFFFPHQKKHDRGAGHKSEIVINADYFEILKSLTKKKIAKSRQNEKTVKQILRVQLSMVKTFCHEVAHAVNFAANGDNWEPYWEDHSLAELGHAWETEVFGGRVEMPKADGSGPLLIAKWPSAGEHKAAERMPRRRNPKGSSTYYLIPIFYHTRISQQTFWDECQFMRVDPGLRVPKILGLRIYSMKPIDQAWSASRSSEGNWRSDNWNIVRRGSFGDGKRATSTVAWIDLSKAKPRKRRTTEAASIPVSARSDGICTSTYTNTSIMVETSPKMTIKVTSENHKSLPVQIGYSHQQMLAKRVLLDAVEEGPFVEYSTELTGKTKTRSCSEITELFDRAAGDQGGYWSENTWLSPGTHSTEGTERSETEQAQPRDLLDSLLQTPRTIDTGFGTPPHSRTGTDVEDSYDGSNDSAVLRYVED